MAETLHDDIDVGAVFGARGMRLLWFSWQGRRRMIREIAYAWKEMDGLRVLRYFSVTDGAAVYELCFDPERLRWSLTKVAHESA